MVQAARGVTRTVAIRMKQIVEAGIDGHGFNIRSWRRPPIYTSVAVLALTPGTRLSPYEILAPLGAGGPAFARVQSRRELWRGLAEAHTARTVC
jgi:hypothetical protein